MRDETKDMNADTGRHRTPPRLAVVVPCLNEQEALPHTASELQSVLSSLKADGLIDAYSFVLYVDDGSTDATWPIISALSAKSSGEVCGLRLAANAGHQHAIMAGLRALPDDCDAAVTIDADLQDDPAAIRSMITCYLGGADVVYGVRRRRGDSRFKRSSAHAFYGLRHSLGVPTVPDHADYRLLSQSALRELALYDETNLFLRGIVPMLGLNQQKVYYDRARRVAGHSKYPLRRMLNFAADGITSFSARPARMILWLGIIFMLISLAILIYVLIRYFNGHTIAGWTSTILSIWFCTALLLMAIGILGEYIAKVYIEVKHRPHVHIRERLGI